MTRRSIFKVFTGIFATGSLSFRPPPPSIPPPPSAPDLSPWLREWLEKPIQPILKSDDPLETLLLAHQLRNSPLPIIYDRSSDTPDLPRPITPILLFRKEASPSTYLLAWCHRRQAPRTFNLSHLHPV